MTINQQTLKGNWNEIKGQLLERWGDLSGDELESTQGNVEQLIGAIQQRTGEAREAVEQYLEELANDGSSLLEKTTGAARHYVHSAQESVQDVSRHAADTVMAGYAKTERAVQRRPMESLAVCFGTGLITGALLGLMFRSR